MINTKFASRKLRYYIDNNMDYSNPQAVINILMGDILIGDIDNASDLANYLITNGFIFSKSSFIPANVSYDSGEDPGIQLQFAYLLKKLYEMTGTESYQITYQSILQRLNSNMDIGTTGAGLSSFALLYDSDSNIVPTFRSGFYTKEAFPVIWYLVDDYSENYIECINKLKDSFVDFTSKTGIEFGFTPFYNLELPENSSYGTYDTWLFGGVLGDESSFSHHYITVLNLTFYYWENYRLKGKRDFKIKQMLDKFFENIISRTDLPTDINYDSLYAGSETVYAGSENIYAGQEDIYAITYGDYNYEFAAILVIAGILKFKVDKEDSIFLYIETIINDLISHQITDGSFDYSSGSGFTPQSYTFLAFSMYQSLFKKSYFDIINESFGLLNLDRINENNYTTHSQKNVLDFCRESMNNILTKRAFEFTHSKTSIPYTAGVYEYNLDSLNIDPHRIECIGYYASGGSFQELIEKTYTDFLQYRNNSTVTGSPVFYAINQNKMYIYSTPDADYGLQVWHYKLEDYNFQLGKIPDLLPYEWTHVLKWMIAEQVSKNRGNNLSRFFEIWAKKVLSALAYDDSVDLSEEMERASSVRWY